MIAAEILKTIGERFQSSATVKNVYGDPITNGDRTVIPVARISYAVGGGGGTSEAEQVPGGGGGGGGCVSAAPVGFIEITVWARASFEYGTGECWARWLRSVQLSDSSSGRGADA